MNLLEPFVRKTSDPSRSFGASQADWLGLLNMVGAGGLGAMLGLNTTMPGQKAETIDNNFAGYVMGGFASNAIIFGLEQVRLRVFSQARFQWQALENGRPTKLFGTSELAGLEAPWPGGITSDLLAVMLLHADFAGNSYSTRQPSYVRPGDGEVVCLRPDWTQILLAPRPGPSGGTLGLRRVGYAYFQDGIHGRDVDGADEVFLAGEVAHFAPTPDPTANYRGMSWLTPVIREIQADGAATAHKLKFFENGATPNLVVKLPKEVGAKQFREFVELMDGEHQGLDNAYKTLYTAGGADVTVVGADMRQIDFKVTQGAGETRLALAAGVHPTVAALSEGMQGASLNAGNFAAARRLFSDITLAHLWGNVAGSLQTIFPPPVGSRLTVDKRDIPLLQEDEKDAAEILNTQAAAIRTLTDGGYDPATVVVAVLAGDLSTLTHTGLVPVQLQKPGAGEEGDGARQLSLVEMVQKVYLGVGTVLTAKEAREMLNAAGAKLTGPGPSDEDPKPAKPARSENADGEVRSFDVHQTFEFPAGFVNVEPSVPNVVVRNESPVVNVAGATVNVEPTPVEVRNVVLPAPAVPPPAKRPSKVEYDDQGRIVRLVEE